MISQRQIPYYSEIFSLEDFFAEPVLVFGFQEITVPRIMYEEWGSLGTREKLKKARKLFRRRFSALRGKRHPDMRIPPEFRARDIVELLANLNIKDVQTLDFFDRRATLRYDMNVPVPESEHGRYGTFMDIGCLEHVFDTRQCLENSFRMVRVGGIYFVVTPANGFFGHGLHVFNPEGIRQALARNGFEILYERYSSRYGSVVSDPSGESQVLMWMVGRKVGEFEEFVCPQQGYQPEWLRPTGPGVDEPDGGAR
jgi:hypothetical protein